MKPLAIDLFCGLGGWTEGLLAEGYDVVGFDIERHQYGEHCYPAQLVIQDVLTLHGSQFRNADLIVASPPCQAYSYRAMPWKRAKALPPPDNTLFEACFRIQREANEANGCAPNGDCITCDGTGNFYRHDEDGDFLDCDECSGTGRKRYIPLIVENVRGAQRWVGRARWNFGSFYLWGDVPALMPTTMKAVKVGMPSWRHPDDPRHVPGLGFNTHADRQCREGSKNGGDSWFKVAHNTTSGKGRNPDGRKTQGHPNIRDGEPHTRHLTNPGEYGVKQHGSGRDRGDKALDERRKEATAIKNGGGGADGWFGCNRDNPMRKHHSGHSSRKFASAMIAKIPLPLSLHIAATFKGGSGCAGTERADCRF